LIYWNIAGFVFKVISFVFNTKSAKIFLIVYWIFFVRKGVSLSEGDTLTLSFWRRKNLYFLFLEYCCSYF